MDDGLFPYELRQVGMAIEFSNEKKADAFRNLLCSKGPEVGIINMFQAPDENIWVVTQYVRVLVKKV